MYKFKLISIMYLDKFGKCLQQYMISTKYLTLFCINQFEYLIVIKIVTTDMKQNQLRRIYNKVFEYKLENITT